MNVKLNVQRMNVFKLLYYNDKIIYTRHILEPLAGALGEVYTFNVRDKGSRHWGRLFD
jgi:hypothetical protein